MNLNVYHIIYCGKIITTKRTPLKQIIKHERGDIVVVKKLEKELWISYVDQVEYDDMKIFFIYCRHYGNPLTINEKRATHLFPESPLSWSCP